MSNWRTLVKTVFIILFFLILGQRTALAHGPFKALLLEGLSNNAYTEAEVLIFNFQGDLLVHEAVGPNQSNKGKNVYDLASLSKVFTAVVVMKLIEDGKIALETKLGEIFPELNLPLEKRSLTIEELLRHRSGLIPAYRASDLASNDSVQITRDLLAYRLWAQKDEKFLYSDTGFTLLAQIIERISGRTLAEHLRGDLFADLMMTSSYYHRVPNGVPLVPSHRDRSFMGRTHDPLARVNERGGGHAGVFSTGHDLYRFLLALSVGDSSYLADESIMKMRSPDREGLRGLGVDLNSPYSEVLKGDCLHPSRSFNHTGFSGTSFIIDPEAQVGIIILTNRTYSTLELAQTNPYMRKLRSQIAQALCRI